MIQCATCPKQAQGKDGLCKGCRLRRETRARTLYHWDNAKDAALTGAYADARSRNELVAALDAFKAASGFSRDAIAKRSTLLGLRYVALKPWSDFELKTLEANAGSVSTKQLGRMLRRSPNAVKQKLWAMELSASVSEGYSKQDLRRLFCVSNATVDGWIGRGWMALDADGRVPHAAVERFCWDHMDEYRLASCEERWLKSMLRTWIERQRLRGFDGVKFEIEEAA